MSTQLVDGLKNKNKNKNRKKTAAAESKYMEIPNCGGRTFSCDHDHLCGVMDVQTATVKCQGKEAEKAGVCAERHCQRGTCVKVDQNLSRPPKQKPEKQGGREKERNSQPKERVLHPQNGTHTHTHTATTTNPNEDPTQEKVRSSDKWHTHTHARKHAGMKWCSDAEGQSCSLP